MPRPSWTDHQIGYLKNRWKAGASARVIGGEMGFTRSAVLGKAHRLGLASRKDTRMTEEDRKESRRRTDKKRYPDRKPRQKREKEMGPSPIVTPVFQGALNIPFADLRPFSKHSPNQCRYIAAEPPGPDYLACGNETPPGESYCPHCFKITRANYTNTPAERAQSIRLGVRKHLRLVRAQAA